MTAPTIEEAKGILAGTVEYDDLSSSRRVYLSKVTDWVYKFESEGDEFWTPQEQNREEWDTYMFLRENPDLLPEGTAMPELVLLEDESFLGGCVIASRYVEVVDTIPDCKWMEERCRCRGVREQCWWEAMHNGGPLISDLWGNVFYDEHGTYWLLDLGYGSAEVST